MRADALGRGQFVEECLMRYALSRYAFRLSNHVPELITVFCYVLGLAACVFMLMR
jgi:hypothetical protein